MRDLLEYIAIIVTFYLFLVWIACMQQPAPHPEAFPQTPLTSQEYN